MLGVNYERVIPYPFAVVLGQYFDLEHIQFVHPQTLGEVHLITTRGNIIIYEQLWPRRWGIRRRSLVQQEFIPPNEIWFDFLRGQHKGIRVHSRLHEHPEGTLVQETYYLSLPNWSWLRAWLRPGIARQVDRIWEEDLRVRICYGGWPGISRQT